MGPQTSRGQILVECALSLFVLIVLFISVVDFSKSKKLKDHDKRNQISDLSKFKNSKGR